MTRPQPTTIRKRPRERRNISVRHSMLYKPEIFPNRVFLDQFNRLIVYEKKENIKNITEIKVFQKRKSVFLKVVKIKYFKIVENYFSKKA